MEALFSLNMIVSTFLTAVYIGFKWYSCIGLLFGVPFVLVGVKHIDASAQHAAKGFKWIILPGVILLWPLLLVRWMKHSLPPTEKTAHKVLAAQEASHD